MDWFSQLASRLARLVEGDREIPAATPEASNVEPLDEDNSAPPDEATVAAIAIALALESGTSPTPQFTLQPGSVWRTAGRMAQMRRPLR